MSLASTKGAELFYTVDGEGEPILLIPGLGATHLSFAALTAELSVRFQVIRMDLEGVGQSSKSRADYSMEDWADDVLAVLDALHLKQAHICGSSLGGCVAQVFAERYPERTRSLILIASFSEIDHLLERNYRFRISLVEQMGMNETVGEFAILALFGRSFLETEKGRTVATAAVAGLRTNDPTLYARHLRALLRFGRCEPEQVHQEKFTARLAHIQCPALVMCGEEDVLTVPKFSKLMASKLPNAELVIQEGCGHASVIEQPAESAAKVAAFIQRLHG